jgi:hypothetical protein
MIHKKLNAEYCTPYTLVNVQILCTLYTVDEFEVCEIMAAFKFKKSNKLEFKINMNVDNRIPKQSWPSTSKGRTHVGDTKKKINSSSCSKKKKKKVHLTTE